MKPLPIQLHVSTFTTFILAGLLMATGGCGNNKKPAAEVIKDHYSFWPPAPDEPHVQFLVSFESSADIRPQRSKMDEMIYGKDTQETLSMSKPYGVAMWNGRIYACDIRGNGVMVLDLKQKQTRLMGASGSGMLGKGVDVTVADDGTKYVADQVRGAVVVFDAGEKFVKAITSEGLQPVGVAVFKDLLYVADFGKEQNVKVFNRTTGQLLRTIGEAGDQDGQFIRPLGMAVDKAGDLFVADTFRCRVQEFGPDGKFIMGFGQNGDRPGMFVRPKHLAVDSQGLIYVDDSSFNNVQIFDEKGAVMGYFGSAGSHPGAMELPAGLCVHEGDLDLFQKYVHPAFAAERLVIVTNQFGPHKIAVYAMGKLKPGKTVADISSSRNDVSAGVQESKSTTQPAAPAPATQPLN